MQAHLVHYETNGYIKEQGRPKADAAARGVDGDTGWVHGDTFGFVEWLQASAIGNRGASDVGFVE